MVLNRLFLAALFLIFSVSVVSAYTVVMRDGRRVEIPNEFTVTSSTLTYDVGNGIQVTIQLNTVDVASTEQVNGEARGSLLQRANAPKVPMAPTPQTRSSSAERSITNADLEKYRNARVENEKRREELGMPSLEERQREVAAIDERTVEHVRSIRAQEEAVLRSRAEALRAEMAATEAQFASWPQRSQEIPLSYLWGSFPAFSPFDNVGFGITAGRFNRFRRFTPSPFSGFLSTPITPFPTFPSSSLFGRRGRPLIFTNPGARNNPRPMRHGPRR